MDAPLALKPLILKGLLNTSAAPEVISGSEAFPLRDLVDKVRWEEAPDRFAGKSVLVLTRRQTAAAFALAALDGLAKRMVLATPDFRLEHLETVARDAELDLIVTDRDDLGPLALPVIAMDEARPSPAWRDVARPLESEWALFTSGTTGAPKMVGHTLSGLAGAILNPAAPPQPSEVPVIWGTYYDIRRYGGLQILLRALLGGAGLRLTEAGEGVEAFLQRLARTGVTHLTGTPSHWRIALMAPEIASIDPSYVRLSGEIADQAVLDRLAAQFPKARIGHAYASTEAGVGFEVTDGKEGFPRAFLDRTEGPVLMKLAEGVLFIRSARTARRYLGEGVKPLIDADGFVDTDDMIEVRDGRCYFAGRRAGIINVGGLKVHPEEVEAVINTHPQVHASRVYARKNPITGALVAAEIQLKAGLDQPPPEERARLKTAVIALVRDRLGAAKTPASIAFVESLPISAGGKLERRRA